MNTEIKERWVAALRNPEATQVKGRLTEIDDDGKVIGNCCLGVLCELALADGIVRAIDHLPVRESEFDKDGYRGYVPANATPNTFVSESGTLPQVVHEWAGVGSHNPRVPFPFEDGAQDYPTNLSTLNDSYSKSFAEIADLIEKYL